jgi:Predicted transcriptional regulator
MEDEIPEHGLLRLSKVLQLIPVSKTTWWAGVRSGRFPKPAKLGPHTTCWYWQDIQPLIEKPSPTTAGKG